MLFIIFDLTKDLLELSTQIVMLATAIIVLKNTSKPKRKKRKRN